MVRALVIAMMFAAAPRLAPAQQDTVSALHQPLPRNVQREVVDRWNSAVALRSSERLEIQSGQEVHGDVAVERGPAVIAGHVTGNVLAVNGDVVLQPTGRVDGDILVVGGDVQGRLNANVGGAIRIYRQTLDYHLEGERMVAEHTAPDLQAEPWWRRIERRRTASWTDPLRIAQAGAYNRVEGLPISIGPAIVGRRRWGTFHLDAAAVVRTGSSFDDAHGDVGHAARAEVRFGRGAGFGIGARLFNIVQPVESWQLSDAEVALGSFLVHRDYRDYHQRHGARVYANVYATPDLTLTAGFSDERWSSRELRDPFTLFHNQDAWRPNPMMDEGLFHVASARVTYDTRTDEDDPWSGWFVTTDFESGRGSYTSIAPTSNARVVPSGPISYARGFLDARRYNHLWPDAQLNLRLVLGGWLNGDEMPLERRLSVDGPGSLPGFDFRSARSSPEVGTCATSGGIPGVPTECDRIALMQMEYRGNLHLNVTPDWDEWPGGRYRSNTEAQWVLFLDTGRGWRVGAADTVMTYPRGRMPPFSSFRTDLGLGFDFGYFGIYGAKSVSRPDEPVNFFVRLRHRF